MHPSLSGQPGRTVPSLPAARWSTRAHFFCSGFLFAAWGVHIPTVKAVYGVGEGALGLAMLAAGVGALIGLSQAGALVGRYGARAMALGCGVFTAVAVAVLLSLPGFAALLAVLAVFGLASGVFDVAINAEASELEHREARPLMSGFHGMFSLGGMAGAGLGSALLAAGVAPVTHLAGVSVLAAVTIAVACQNMLPPQAPVGGQGRFRLPRGTLLVLGVMAALGLIAEGAIYDWSVLYLHKELGSPQDQAALAYASFSAAMALTRFGGDWIRARVPPASLLRGSALLAAAAMALVLWTRQPWVALVGMALVGVGFANVVPILFSAAARVPGVSAAHGIAAVSSVGYLGFMTGPPVIGVLAQWSSLTAALGVVVLFAGVLAAASRRALRGHTVQ
jgi:predicted MFS family arabinose efflux permease